MLIVGFCDKMEFAWGEFKNKCVTLQQITQVAFLRLIKFYATTI